jgi:shikimate kinase
VSAPTAVLIGAPGSGKTTVGALLAERLGQAFTDIDDVVARHAGKPVSEIFIDDGEEEFRRLERAAVAESLHGGGVVALGGGAVMDPRTRSALASHRVVYLQVEFDDALKRVGLNKARPLLAGNPRAKLKSLLAERLPVYEQLAGITVPTSGYHPEEVVDGITAHLQEAS